MGSKFAVFASKTSRFAGHPLTFVASCLIIVVWGAMGPFLGYSDTWQLAINTGTTIVTFLMVFLIQNTQNRESAAVQIKLDELIRATHSARNTLLDLEELSEDQLNTLLERYRKLAKQARDPNISEVKELGKPEVVAAIAEEVDAAADAPADSEERKERVETAAAKAVGVAAEDVLSPVKERAVRKRRKAADQNRH